MERGERAASPALEAVVLELLDQGGNVVCNVDPSQPPPTMLDKLVCTLWTSGATEIEVSAKATRRSTRR